MIDVFFKFVCAVQVHSKDAKAITAVFGQVLTTANPRHPKRWQTYNSKQILQLELPDPDKTPLYPALCQWEQTKGGRGGTIQSNHQNQDRDIFARPRHRALERYFPGLGLRLQPLAPPLHRHGAGRCSEEGRELSLGSPILATETPTLNLKFRKEPWCGPAATRQYLTKATCRTEPMITYSK